jgi:membrane protein implicated in regulation of membrane protease activity
MNLLNRKSATALSWFAIIVNLLGLTALMLGGQFIFSVTAAVFALIPTIFARQAPQFFGGAVLVLSLALVVAGYPEFKQGRTEYEQQLQRRAKARSAPVSVPPAANREERK